MLRFWFPVRFRKPPRSVGRDMEVVAVNVSPGTAESYAYRYGYLDHTVSVATDSIHVLADDMTERGFYQYGECLYSIYRTLCDARDHTSEARSGDWLPAEREGRHDS